MAEIRTVNRVFSYAGVSLPDPDSGMSPEQVKQHYQMIYPELVNASVEGGEFDGENQNFSFRRGTGTKG